jgi:hypothetical protein
METIVAKLDELAELKAATDLARIDYETKRTEILRVVQTELEALDAEYAPRLDAATQRMETLEAEIKSDVLRYGASVKGSRLHAVYSRGRVSWDTRALDAYALAHPEVTAFRKQGEPSVSLRLVKQDIDKPKTRC